MNRLIVHFTQGNNVLNVTIEMEPNWQEDRTAKATLLAVNRLYRTNPPTPHTSAVSWADYLAIHKWDVQVWDGEKVSGSMMAQYFTEVWDTTVQAGGVNYIQSKVERCTATISPEVIEAAMSMPQTPDVED